MKNREIFNSSRTQGSYQATSSVRNRTGGFLSACGQVGSSWSSGRTQPQRRKGQPSPGSGMCCGHLRSCRVSVLLMSQIPAKNQEVTRLLKTRKNPWKHLASKDFSLSKRLFRQAEEPLQNELQRLPFIFLGDFYVSELPSSGRFSAQRTSIWLVKLFSATGFLFRARSRSSISGA